MVTQATTVVAPAGISAQILATQSANLKGYWKEDETSGTTLTDSSGNGNAMTLSGTPATDYSLNQTGETGKCIKWLGLVGIAQIASSVLGADLITQDFTFFTLVNYTATPDSTVMSISNDETFRQIGMDHSHVRSDNLCGHCGDGGVNPDIYVDLIVANDGVWHDITYTRSGTTFSVYKDGGFVNSLVAPFSHIEVNITSLGAINDALGVRQPFNGYQQHAAIWSVALSGAEIAAIHGAR